MRSTHSVFRRTTTFVKAVVILKAFRRATHRSSQRKQSGQINTSDNYK